MTYEQQIKMVLTFMYNEAKCFATSRTYHIPYSKIVNAYNTQVADKKVQDNIREEWCNSKYMDKIQALDFDDTKQEVVVMIWESNNKKKRYTIDNYEEFCKEALVMPPFDDEPNDWEEWYDEHIIHITVSNHDIELDYNADNVNEIEYALREMYEVEMDIRGATTGNTMGSEYRDATWKDILRLNIMRLVAQNTKFRSAIKNTITSFGEPSFIECFREVQGGSWNAEFGVNFHKIDTTDMYKLFCRDGRREAIKEMICTKLEFEEVFDKDGKCSDKTIITDYSIHPAGHLVGWHYGVDFDKDSEVNQGCINDYIKEMIGQ